MKKAKISEFYVPVVLVDGEDYFVTHQGAISVITGEGEGIRNAYKIELKDGGLVRGEKVNDKSKLLEITEEIRKKPEDLRELIPFREWEKHKGKERVRKIRKAYDSFNKTSDFPPIMSKSAVRSAGCFSNGRMIRKSLPE